ncbi:hypothetical protein JP09_005990 [Dehalogenimonas etheniformans]|uniref:Uncharacterized protein n=1 Tax=Dehalogenimonas etheniformans TaxID=1536648 RepID=A0A2P5P6C4_9CHLR|nr:hypothetical protein JP09_005990 [Dehalogenimonas etheniformans]
MPIEFIVAEGEDEVAGVPAAGVQVFPGEENLLLDSTTGEGHKYCEVCLAPFHRCTIRGRLPRIAIQGNSRKDSLIRYYRRGRTIQGWISR